MKRNELVKPKSESKNRKRRGRGNASGLGGEAGRGHKGQKSRSGYSRKGGFEGGQMPLYLRIPKRKGFRSINRKEFSIVNVAVLDANFSDGDEVSKEVLIEKKLIKDEFPVKVLGNGDLTKKLSLKVAAISKSAEEKVKSLSGSIELI